MLKYIRLYEEYTDLNDKGLDHHYSWQDVRDIIQSKLPFIIVDFKTEEDKNKFIGNELQGEEFANQIYYATDGDGRVVEYPSVFIFVDNNKLFNRVKNFNENFDIVRIITGEYGKVIPSLYVDGSQINIGENLFSTINIDEIGSDDYYKYESTYYTFID